MHLYRAMSGRVFPGGIAPRDRAGRGASRNGRRPDGRFDQGGAGVVDLGFGASQQQPRGHPREAEVRSRSFFFRRGAASRPGEARPKASDAPDVDLKPTTRMVVRVPKQPFGLKKPRADAAFTRSTQPPPRFGPPKAAEESVS